MLDNILTEHRRLGLYYVGDKTFISKSDALIFASKTNSAIYWDFNDDVFSKIDWRIPIETSLQELYRQRAQQLRDKYDYLSLFFSGGVDSTNVLHSFIDNNIFLDEIVMYRPSTFASSSNKIDKTPKNVYSEIEFAAIPHLQKYLKDPRTVVRIIDVDSATEELFNSEQLVSQFCTLNNMGTTPVAKIAMCVTDKIWRSLHDAGKKVAHIHGIDKPILSVNDGQYSFQFEDSTMSFNFESSLLSADAERLKLHQYHEFFYWTPDLPQLVIKQCQVVKSVCNNDFIFKLLFVNSMYSSQEKFMSIIHHIYPPHVNAVRQLFATTKTTTGLLAGQGLWFYEIMNTTINGQFIDMVKHTRNNINDEFFATPKTYYVSETSKFDQPTPKNSIRLFKSKKYIL